MTEHVHAEPQVYYYSVRDRVMRPHQENVREAMGTYECSLGK